MAVDSRLRLYGLHYGLLMSDFFCTFLVPGPTPHSTKQVAGEVFVQPTSDLLFHIPPSLDIVAAPTPTGLDCVSSISCD